MQKTIPRETLFEVHTPQVVLIASLKKCFSYVASNNVVVTNDVSMMEAMGSPVTLTRGEYTNIKITTPEDMQVAEAILRKRRHPAPGRVRRLVNWIWS